MALSDGIAWEARADGDNANGGGFKIGATGLDRCQQAGAHATLTTASVVGATTTHLDVSAGDYTVSNDDVGNVVFVTGGSATAGRYEILSVVTGATNRWVVDRSLGTTGQTCPGKMGGAVASPHTITNGIWVGGNTMWIRGAAGTITHTATWLSGNPGTQYTTSTRGNRIIGYNTTRGDQPTGTDRPLILQSTTASMISLQMQGEMQVENLRFDGAGLSGSNGLYVGANNVQVFNCYFTNLKQYGIYGNAGGVGHYVDCEVEAMASASTAGIDAGTGDAIGCWCHDNPCVGFILSTDGTMYRCLSTNNTGGSSDGVQTSHQTRVEQCTFHGNARDGIRFQSALDYLRIIRGNVCTDNGGYGLNFSSVLSPVRPQHDYNAYFGNASGAMNGGADTGGSHTSGDYTTHNVTLAGDPYVDSGTDDYRPNDTDGVDLWGASPFADVDIGALQHDPALNPVAGSGVMGARIQTGY